MNKEAMNRVLDNAEDFVSVKNVIDAICCAIENGTAMPNYIPVCNDLLLSDQLGKISSCITSLREQNCQFPKWKLLKKGGRLPVTSLLMTLDGQSHSVTTTAGVKVGQDCMYMSVDELVNYGLK